MKTDISRINSKISLTWYKFLKKILASILRNVFNLKTNVNSSIDPSSTIYVMNHIHRLDTLIVLTCLPDNTRVIMAYDVIKGHPILSFFIRVLGASVRAIIVSRDNVHKNFALRQALIALNTGQSILIAPEGTRNISGNIGQFHDGVAFLVLKSGSPVVPIVTWGYANKNLSTMFDEKNMVVILGEELRFKKQSSFIDKDERRLISNIIRTQMEIIFQKHLYYSESK